MPRRNQSGDNARRGIMHSFVGSVVPASSGGPFGSLTYGLDIFHRVQSNVLVFMFQFINEHGNGVQVGLIILCSSHCTMCCPWIDQMYCVDEKVGQDNTGWGWLVFSGKIFK